LVVSFVGGKTKRSCVLFQYVVLKKTGKVSFVCPFCCEENTCNEEKTIPIANMTEFLL
jgi:hypothetical protein